MSLPNSSTNEPITFPGYNSIEEFTKNGFKTCIEAIRNANALPSDRDWNFYKTSDSFMQIMNDESQNVLRLMNRIIKCNEVEGNIKNKTVLEKTEMVIEANDIILEKIGTNIDKMNGIRKSEAEPVVIQTVQANVPVNGSWNRPSDVTYSINSPQSTSPLNSIRLITGKFIVRPQTFFKDKIDNSNRFPWEPRIKDKPNSLKPLAIFLEEFEDRQEFSHPYECELDRFEPSLIHLSEEPCTYPKELKDTPLVEISEADQLDQLLETLRTCTEFAVDLEHHSYRSFMGITCLLQISTSDTDYLIDTLKLRDKLHVLNEVFTNKSIVKILHGANSDIEWLQRDLSIYIVNLFDTHQASKILEYSGQSLAYLLKRYCNIVANKQYQLADWRMRPLPTELKTYAREDTHYLIYIYKMMKKELLAKCNQTDRLLKVVYERSNEICKKRYFKPVLCDDSHLDIYRKCKKMFDNRQLYALKEIYAWRDRIAREEDESLAYVLPNHMLIQIAETLPREMQGILACCSPIPPLVRSNALELHQIILRARDQSLEKAIIRENTNGRGCLKNLSKLNVNSPLHCPHDLSHANEFRDDLPTLLSNSAAWDEMKKLCCAEVKIEKSTPKYSMFGSGPGKVVGGRCTKTISAFLSPYERYMLVRPFVQAEEEQAKLAEAQEKEAEAQKKDAEAQEKGAAVFSDDNDERIARIRSHYLKMSKHFNETEQQNAAASTAAETEKSLIELGGTRKRKRELSEVEDVIVIDDTPVKQVQGYKRKHFDDNEVKKNNKNTKKNKKIKKQQEANRQFETTIKDEQPLPGTQRTKRAKRPNKFKKIQELNNSPNKNQGSEEKKTFNKKQHEFKKLQESNKSPNKYQGNEKKNAFNKKQHAKPQQNQFQNPQGNNKNKKFKQKNEEFVPYDYASVDFRQFQGGAGSANTGANVKSKFKAKNHRNSGNRGGRSETFNSKRGGRGGRGGKGGNRGHKF